MAQKSRKQKTSAGLRRSSRPVHPTVVQKVLLDHGLIDSFEPAEAKTAWRGVGGDPWAAVRSGPGGVQPSELQPPLRRWPMSEPLCSNCKHDCADHGRTFYGDTVCLYGNCKCRSKR